MPTCKGFNTKIARKVLVPQQAEGPVGRSIRACFRLSSILIQLNEFTGKVAFLVAILIHMSRNAVFMDSVTCNENFARLFPL